MEILQGETMSLSEGNKVIGSSFYFIYILAVKFFQKGQSFPLQKVVLHCVKQQHKKMVEDL